MSETFHNGSGKSVTLPSDAGPNPEVTAVEVEKKEGQFLTNLDRSFWTVKTIAGPAGQVTEVVLNKFYSKVKVIYVQNFTRAQIEEGLGKDTADQLAAAESEMEGVAKDIIKDLQFDKLNLEGASTKNFGELGGMKGIMDMVKKRSTMIMDMVKRRSTMIMDMGTHTENMILIFG